MSERIYRVVDWHVHFENAGSRKYKKLSWIPMPNTHDGAGFRRVMRQKNGLALYGAWCVVVQVASKAPTRGLLVNDRGHALTAEDLADKCGGDAAVFQRCLEALSDSAIGWLEILPTGSTPPATESVLPASDSGCPIHNPIRSDITRPDPEEKAEDNPTRPGKTKSIDTGAGFLHAGSCGGASRWNAGPHRRDHEAELSELVGDSPRPV